MTPKVLATAVLEVAAIGAAAAGVTSIASVASAGPGAASADVTPAGSSRAPTTQKITFVDQGGWELSRSSALSLLQAVQAAE